MKKKEKKDKMVTVRFTEEEFDQIEEFVNTIGIDDNTFIRNSTSTFINNFYNTEHVEFEPKPTQIRPEPPYSEDLLYDIESARSIKASNRNETFFKDSAIPDEYIIRYGGSKFSLGMIDKMRIEAFIHGELGFPDNHEINWNSPLAGLLVSFLKSSQK